VASAPPTATSHGARNPGWGSNRAWLPKGSSVPAAIPIAPASTAATTAAGAAACRRAATRSAGVSPSDRSTDWDERCAAWCRSNPCPTTSRPPAASTAAKIVSPTTRVRSAACAAGSPSARGRYTRGGRNAASCEGGASAAAAA